MIERAKRDVQNGTAFNLQAIINGTGKKTFVLDPLGFTIKPGKNLYNQLIKNMSESFIKCKG